MILELPHEGCPVYSVLNSLIPGNPSCLCSNSQITSLDKQASPTLVPWAEVNPESGSVLSLALLTHTIQRAAQRTGMPVKHNRLVPLPSVTVTAGYCKKSTKGDEWGSKNEDRLPKQLFILLTVLFLIGEKVASFQPVLGAGQWGLCPEPSAVS